MYQQGKSRRQFLQRTTAGGTALALGGALRGVARAEVAGDRPLLEQGIQIGDVADGRAIVWSRADRPARMLVEWARTPRFHDPVRVRGPHALEVTGLTGRVDLTGLPAGQDIFVRVAFQNLDGAGATSDPIIGHFRTAPRQRRDIRFLWGGDTAGQGWGINPDMGGMKIYRTMLEQNPDFFIHSGDNIYADGPMAPSVTLPDGTIWRNAFLDKVPSKQKVCETLDEFRGAYLYNMCDENVRAFNAGVPQIWQWDDHEVLNNWSRSKDLSADARYTEKRVPTLVARAERAFLEHAPMRWHAQDEEERVYRLIRYTDELDVFVVDMRSYRGPNTANRQTAPGPDTAFLGKVQLDWLKDGLRRSKATWKIVAADMPVGLNIGDGTDAAGQPRWEAIANGDGPVLGREFEIAELLRSIKRHNVKNVVWLTADVHYCAAHFYDPAKAQFTDFLPFWEFVAGPLNAGTFGPNVLDNTFGPQLVFQKVPAAGQANLPPSAGMQFFGQVDIDPRARDLVVQLKDISGNTVFSQRLQAEPCDTRGDD